MDDKYYPQMPNPEYWQKRSEERASECFDKADHMSDVLQDHYMKAVDALQKEVSQFYTKYATKNGITYAQAQQKLTNPEFRVWRLKLRDYLEELYDSADPDILKELNDLSAASQVSRLNALITSIKVECTKLAQVEDNAVTSLLGELYSTGYYQTIFDIQKGMSVGTSFSLLNTKAVQEAIRYPWSGEMFSERIWGNRDKLVRLLKQEMVQGIIQGKSVQKMASAIGNQMEVGKKASMRLVITESAYIYGKATMDGYMEAGVDEYEFMAVLDGRTSGLCTAMNGEVFKCSEAHVGVNYPPLHPKCRSTTKAYFGDSYIKDISAKADQNKTYPVPEKMTFDQWAKEHMKNTGNDVDDSDIIGADNFKAPFAMGAMAKRFYVKKPIDLTNGVELYIAEGTDVTGVKAIAEGEEIRDVQRLINTYRLPNGELTKAKDWKKVRGTAVVTDGVSQTSQEVHWYQCENIGKVEFKIKTR